MARYGDASTVGYAEPLRDDPRRYVVPGAVGAGGAWAVGTAIKPRRKAILAAADKRVTNAEDALTKIKVAGKPQAHKVGWAQRDVRIARAVRAKAPEVVARVSAPKHRLARGGLGAVAMAGAGLEAWRRRKVITSE